MKRILTDFAKLSSSAAILLIGDLAALLVSFLLAYIVRANLLVDVITVFPSMQHGLDIYLNVWGLLILWPLLFAYEGLYPSIGMGFWEETKAVLRCTCIAFFLVVLTFVTKTAVQYSRPIIFLAFLFSLICLPSMRRGMRLILCRSGLWSKDVILIGSSESLKPVNCYLKKHLDVGLRPAGIITPQADLQTLGLTKLADYEDLEFLTLRAHEVIISMPGLTSPELARVIDIAGRIAPVVNVVPDLYGLASSGVQTHDLDGLLLLEMEDRLARQRNRITKRIFDASLSLLALVFLSPFLIIIVLLIRISSPGPAIFGHTRIGRSGRPFTCYKFRTMILNAQDVLAQILESDPQARAEWEQDFKLKNDPRITRIGGVLRRTSLDELPQLFNVVRGEMSLVGPRPIVNEEIQKYGDKVRYFFKVTPGITGLWQVSGRNDINYDERVLLDEYYAKNWSLWLDIEIIIRTLGAVFKKKGAY